MSFRTRLTSFFVLIVVVPMVAVGFLVFRLIGDSHRAKPTRERAVSRGGRQPVPQRERCGSCRRPGARPCRGTVEERRRCNAADLARRAGLARATLSTGSTVLADVGDTTAIAPGAALLKTPTAAQPIRDGFGAHRLRIRA